MSWKFDDLPVKGGVGDERVPYSGAIYLDKYGGTVSALRKYDQAFHRGRMLATAHEQWDTIGVPAPCHDPRRSVRPVASDADGNAQLARPLQRLDGRRHPARGTPSRA